MAATTTGTAAGVAEASSPVPAVTRAAALLAALAAAHGAPLSVSELSRQLGLPKSSTANLCLALEAERFVARGESGYTLGRRLVELGGAYVATVDQVREFYAACRRSPVISGLTARVAVLEGLDVLYLARFDGAQPIRLTANIGDRFPAHCTATGKVLLAALAPEALDERLRGRRVLPALTEKSISDPGELRAELARVRELGYGLDDEETTPGVTCIAIAVPGARTDSDAFAISATTLTGSLSTGGTDLSVVHAELREIAAALGNPLVPVL